MNGAALFVKLLEEQGTDIVFGYPGGTVLSIYDALYQERRRIRHIRTAHEQGAAHAADGYARVSGKTGVCIATSWSGSDIILLQGLQMRIWTLFRSYL